MRDNDKILFSGRFQEFYDHLGMFCHMYAADGGEGIDRDAFTAALQNYNTDTRAILELLTAANIISGREGRLYLNPRRYHSMTMWDLLVVAEPWLAANDPPPGLSVRLEELKTFTRAELIRETFPI